MTRDAPSPPTDAELRAMLGESFDVLQEFTRRNTELRPEWKYYGAKYGWSLKLFLKKRNLCFISPHPGFFTVAFALGARAVERALASNLPESVKRQITEARPYAEGRGVRIDAGTTQDLGPAQLLLEIKKNA